MKLILCGILIFSWLVVRPSSAAHPLSPCPDVFNYEGEEPEYNLWYGEIWLKTVQSLVGIWLDIELDRPSDLMVSWTGEITTDDNLKYTVLNLMQRLKPGVPVLSRIMVKFNRSKGIPRVRSIRLNGRQICPKDSAAFTPKPEESAVGSQSSQNTKRPDPDFGESPDEYPISNNKPSTQSNNNSNKNPSNTQQSNNNNSNKNKNPPNKQPNTTKPPNANKPPNGGNNPPKNRPRPTMTTEEPSFSTKKTTTRKPSQSNAGRPNTVSLQAPDPNGDINSLISGYLENQQQNTSVYITTIDVDQLNLLEQENTGSSSETPRPDTSNNNNNNFGQSKPSTNSRPPAVQPSWSSNNNQGTSSSSISTTNVPQLSDICGRVRMTVPLVTYGESTHRGQWPWHAALYTIEGINLNYNCGGSLISKNKVITAAHCVMERFYDEVIDSRKLVIHLGKYHQVQYSEEMGVQTKSVTRITVYPTYNTTNFLGDIAVLTLTTSVVFSPYVVPVCLWDENSVDLKDVEGKDGTVVGWGWDEKDKPSVELKMAQMPIVSRETCVSSNPKVFSLFTSEKTFCAGFRNGTSVCNGDSGGGMVLNMDSRWYLRGVVSNAVSKENQRVCDPKHYVVFTDVAKYLDFVKENL